MSSRPHTPRRFGTAHTPQPPDLLAGGHKRGSSVDDEDATDIADLYPKYWKNSGAAFRLRPNSAPSTRPRPPSQEALSVAAAASVAPADDTQRSITPRVRGVLDFKKIAPRSPRLESGHQNSIVAHDHNTVDAFALAAPQISPRTRGFSMSAAPSRGKRPSTASISVAPLQSVSALDNTGIAVPSAPQRPTFRFAAMTTREQANYAAGFGEAPTAAYYRKKLAESGAPPSTIRTNDDAEGYLQTFVDQQDHQFTVGVRGATEQRAKLIVRQRSYPLSSGSHATLSCVASSISPRKTVNWRKMIGRDAAPVAAAAAAPESPRNPNPDVLSSARHVPGVFMTKVTGRTAPVSTVLPMQQAQSHPSSMRGPTATCPPASARHIPGVDMSKLRPHTLHSSPRNMPGAQMYSVKDAIVWRKAPSAIIA